MYMHDVFNAERLMIKLAKRGKRINRTRRSAKEASIERVATKTEKAEKFFAGRKCADARSLNAKAMEFYLVTNMYVPAFRSSDPDSPGHDEWMATEQQKRESKKSEGAEVSGAKGANTSERDTSLAKKRKAKSK